MKRVVRTIRYPGSKIYEIRNIYKIVNPNDCFIDYFGGSGIVGVNMDNKFILYNEINDLTRNMFNYLIEEEYNKIVEGLNNVYELIAPYKYPDRKHPTLRKMFIKKCLDILEKCRSTELYYPCLYYLNNNKFSTYTLDQIDNGDYNIDSVLTHPDQIAIKLFNLKEKIKGRNIIIFKKDIKDIVEFSQSLWGFFKETTFYFDPPYYNTWDGYSGKRSTKVQWTIEMEHQWHQDMLYLDSKGFKIIIHNTVRNPEILKFISNNKQFKVQNIKSINGLTESSRDVNGARKDILVTNYEI